MTDKKRILKKPPWLENADSQPRRVGVELEMSGFDIDVLVNKVAAFFDLNIFQNGRYDYQLQGDPAGEWVIELDSRLLKRLGREERSNQTITDKVSRSAEDAFVIAAQKIVPLEIVSPPLPLNRLVEVEKLIAHLRQAGAKGTGDSAINAFSMQLNPELPSYDAKRITACLKAFLCFYEWLYERADIDLSRRVSNYIDPFPTDYVKKILAPDYWPNLEELIDDYIAFNPTRNRALDMLPLFKFLDEERVLSKLDDELIKSRPTFHYRLPDCKIDNEAWGLFLVWNDWVEVERIAADETRLQACCEAYLKFLNSPIERIFNKWSTAVQEEWINQ